MPNTLNLRLRAWSEGRRRLLDEIDALAPERLVAKPRPGKWSIIEIMEHMVLADRECLQGMPDPNQLVTRSRHIKDRVSYPLVMFVLACHIPAKAASPRFLPRGQSSLAELRRDSESVERWFQAYVEGLDPRDLEKAVFAHPVTGPLTVSQFLRMAELHQATHTRQIRRLERLTN